MDEKPKQPPEAPLSPARIAKAVANAQASLELEGMRMTPEEEADLIRAMNEGVSEEDYMLRIFRDVFESKKKR